MIRIFHPDSPYKKRARFLAWLWTLLILIACFTPAKEIPKVDIPLIDKWTHLVLFGIFSFLWLCARPLRNPTWLATVFFISVAFGAFIEVMQGLLTFLGRSSEFMDAVADAIGGLLGIGLFALLAFITAKKQV
jgi:VanZ family protein